MSEQPNDQENDLLLGGRYRVHLEDPLPKDDNATAAAFVASDRRDPKRRLKALVCKPGLIPRLDIIPQLSRLTRLPMVNPLDAGPVIWPETGGRRFVVLFDHMTDEALIPTLDESCAPLREDQIFHRVIKPIVPALKELSARSIKHRAIRADNVFYTDEARNSAVLGECVSGPPGMAQPVVYEPVDIAMANPAGRGQGTLADDLYAFGVLIVALLTGGDPAAGMSDEDLIDAKIRLGSYTALVRDLQLSLRMIEPLRGLLCDDPAERWTLDELELWAGGRQLSPKQTNLATKASRALPFAGNEYLTRPALSLAMGNRWGDAATLVTSGELASWLRRSLGDEDGANAIQALSANPGQGPNSADRLVSNALIVLEPKHPLRYRGLSARIDGLATLLAVNYADDTFRAAFVEMLRAKLPQIYLQSVAGKGVEQAPLMKTYDMFIYFMDRPQAGNGLERALYEANRGWPCQSPLIGDDYVCELDDLLPALERAARRGALSERAIDRHIAGFCAARAKPLADRAPSLLTPSGNVAKERLGLLAVYAEVHRVTNIARRFPALTAWLAAMMTPVFDGFHNRKTRDAMVQEVDKVGGQGDISTLYHVLDNSETRHEDETGFEDAQAEYRQLQATIEWLAAGGLSAPDYVQAKSRQAATLVSATIAGLTVVTLSLLFVT